MIEVRGAEEVDTQWDADGGDSAGDRPGDSEGAVCRDHGREREREEHAAGAAGGAGFAVGGEVILDGVTISNLEEDKLAEVRGQRIGFVFQSYQLIPTLTALENVMLPYELNARGDARKKAEALLAAVGLAGPAASLSGAAVGRGAAAGGAGAGVCAGAADCAGG